MGKRIVLTRPREDSETLAAELAGQGYTAIVEPLTSIQYARDMDAKLLPYIAENATLLATSRHAALAPHGCPQHIPWIVSGSSTVQALKSMGCENITFAGQTADSLRQYLAARAPDMLPYVYLAGRHRTLDLSDELTPLGYQLHTIEAYEAKEHDAFSPRFASAWKQEPADAVLFFSSRHAEIFEQLIRKASLEASLPQVQAFCFSEQIAHKLSLPWKAVHASATPDIPELLGLLETA